MRLSSQTCGRLPAFVERPGYDREAQAVGIVHFGLGAFHRAHQAVYTDDAMAAGDRDWAVAGVSMRSSDVRDQMVPQDGLYTLTDRGSGSRVRLLGAVVDVLAAPRDPTGVITRLAAASTRIASFTITEKGYHARTDGTLDTTAPDVAGDLAQTSSPRTIFGYLQHGLEARRAAGLPGLTLMSCDNLAGNGPRLAGLLDQFLTSVAPDLARWTRDECAFPSTMVDRIVPAVTDADRAEVAAAIGLQDHAAVITETFRQWVIQDRFAGPRPRWEIGGAQIVADVATYEAAKLRLLNGAHSALAYLGLARGHAFVHEALKDPAIRPVIDRLMRHEAASSLADASGLKLDAYVDALLARFANAALPHRLAQIAMDGSQKIPQRWLETLAFHQSQERACPALLTALAAWVDYVRGDQGPIVDPLAEHLANLWRRAGRRGVLRAMFGPGGLYPDLWVASPKDIVFMQAWLG